MDMFCLYLNRAQKIVVAQAAGRHGTRMQEFRNTISMKTILKALYMGIIELGCPPFVQ